MAASPAAAIKNRARFGALRDYSRSWHTAALGAGLCVAAIISLGVGALPIPPGEILAIILSAFTGAAETTGPETAVLLDIRLPRVVMAALVGGGLALSGALMQLLFRNPLAEPGLIGISAGANLGAALAITASVTVFSFIGEFAAQYLAPVCAFAGGLAATFVALRIAQKDGKSSVALVLLAGVAITALAFSGVGLMLYFADDNDLRDLTYWSMGSLGGAAWRQAGVITLVLAPCAAFVYLKRRELNLLNLGEAEAWHSGVNVERLKLRLIWAAALMVGVCTAYTGIIGFVGLVAPHIGRMLVGGNFRQLFPFSLLGGGLLLVLADLAARTLVAPVELPLGVLTSFIGGPFLIGLIWRQKKLDRL